MAIERIPIHADRGRYLAFDTVIDHDAPSIREQAERLRGSGTLDTIRRSFEWVRDSIEHSLDFRRSPTTCAASEVLREGTGICFAKSHLLAAFLRANGVPAGLGYQRLTIDGPNPPHSLHGFVVVELPEGRWFAIDARGNKPGVDARFAPPVESLAFELVNDGEWESPLVFARPLAAVVRCLRENDTWSSVLANLPDVPSLDASSEWSP